MTASYLNGNPDKEIWAVAEEESVLQCVAFCAQEKLTNGTWNLYLLAVDLASQRHGVGTAMVSWIERRLCDQQARLLLVETSSLPEFEPARRFYLRYGFEQEGLIRDFYDTEITSLSSANWSACSTGPVISLLPVGAGEIQPSGGECPAASATRVTPAALPTTGRKRDSHHLQSGQSSENSQSH